MKDLIEKIEAAEGGYAHLDLQIFEAVGAPLPKECFGLDLELGRVGDGYVMQVGEMQISYKPPAYTSSIDSALTLVPEGCGWSVKKGSNELPQFLPHAMVPCDGRVFFFSKGIKTQGIAATPALALCAAALRARNTSHAE